MKSFYLFVVLRAQVIREMFNLLATQIITIFLPFFCMIIQVSKGFILLKIALSMLLYKTHPFVIVTEVYFEVLKDKSL